ncbi:MULTISPECIES: lipocalin family protein [Paraburkholderia]|uniref:Outer membrane lipoprotein Blc n=2 Tax=Paraburkholderia TaxID=1822464 RepID=A0A7Y9WHM3_9BURK|nr:lipocalin family protein [Paraburkholderia bryophila]NYH20997.1 apolipoprotein D and lipocalin family protein [Paraburkholderia bryophila]
MFKSFACAASLVICMAGCAHAPAIPADTQAPQSACVAGPPIDLARYMGRWYVIADTPFLSEQDYVGSYDEWTQRGDGRIDDHYLGRRHGFDQPVTGSHFVARVMPDTGNTKWRVELIWPFEVVVVTAYVDPDYRYTIRCMADGNMMWLLSRTPAMDDPTYAEMRARIGRMGFHLDRVQRVPQSAGQIGQPGFQ